MEPGGPQARNLLQRLPLQDMTLAPTWLARFASWPRHMPWNILISRSSRGIRACATTRRAPTRQPPDRPSRGEIFARVHNHSAGTESVILHAPPYSLTSDQTWWFRECMTDYVAVSSPRVIKIRKHPGTARIIQLYFCTGTSSYCLCKSDAS